MQSFAFILAEECSAEIGPTGRDYIRRIIASAERLDRLIQDVLTYSRIARAELRLVPIDSGALIRDIMDSYPSFQGPAVDIRTEGRFPVVLGNEAVLTQCISNLLGNAVKYHNLDQPNPYIKVTFERFEDYVEIAVADNGQGIPEDSLPQIFEMFYRASINTEGTGLGLYIVNEALTKVKGSIVVESTFGKGSTFRVQLDDA